MNKYCFCVVKHTEDNDKILENKDLEIVNYKDITMVVKDIEEDEIFPTGEEILKHETTIESIMKKAPIIPMSFGNICKTEEEIESFLKNNYNKLIRLFERFEKRMEVGLKVYWTEDAFSQEVEDKKIKKLKEEIMKNQGSSQLRISEVGRLVEERVDKIRDYYVDQIHKKLSQSAYESKLNIAHTPRMVLNSAFLIDKDKENEFDKLMNTLFDKYRDSLIFKYTGPWPPYNFIEETFVIK
ncbi:GvpL/GvpF family gas vesicle protein [Marinisporobacter balticus]|uniref:Gas vesicle protein GvpL/GvpF n=1 Tax=Marinisporobacter balticus TaxID=2018667 RepID=A0A4R2L2C4_9FIRM|nr:GvpL/GvpF family gas vesicle protein [Marinisporobacter balticus]TCO77906.1 gas vesicle protein GvpL/GvpF [Marinisporobacter balticus]